MFSMLIHEFTVHFGKMGVVAAWFWNVSKFPHQNKQSNCIAKPKTPSMYKKPRPTNPKTPGNKLTHRLQTRTNYTQA